MFTRSFINDAITLDEGINKRRGGGNGERPKKKIREVAARRRPAAATTANARSLLAELRLPGGRYFLFFFAACVFACPTSIGMCVSDDIAVWFAYEEGISMHRGTYESMLTPSSQIAGCADTATTVSCFPPKTQHFAYVFRPAPFFLFCSACRLG